MKKDLCLVYNNPDPSAGGIPRYAYRIIEGLKDEEVEFSEIDFSELERGRAVDKILNLVHRRRRFIFNNQDQLGDINHFLQPELYFPTDGTDIVTVHDLFMKTYWDPNSFYEKVQKRIYSRRVDRCIEHADILIAVSEQTKQTLIDSGARESDIKVINSGIRDKFDLKRKYRSREKKIGYIGDFRPRKRVERLLKEFEDINIDYSLSVAGYGGPNEDSLKEKYSSNPGITFEDRIPEEDLVDWYNSLRAFFFPTELEGFGLPVLEATACGTPVFVYEDAKISEEIRKYCYTVGNLEKVPGILEGIREEELEEKSEKVKEEFSWDQTVEETIGVYDER
ncbi:MAG: glycosyltransferase [Candidatus Nanosalina sp.]